VKISHLQELKSLCIDIALETTDSWKQKLYRHEMTTSKSSGTLLRTVCSATFNMIDTRKQTSAVVEKCNTSIQEKIWICCTVIVPNSNEEKKI